MAALSKRSASLVLVAGLLFAVSAEAVHRADHRYVVLGYVQDQAHQPVASLPVRALLLKTGLSYETQTSADGFYVVLVHLHDEDVGEAIEVTAGRDRLRIRTRFDARDAKSPRGTRVDFRAGHVEERPEAFRQTLRDYLRR